MQHMRPIQSADQDGINEHPNKEFGEICDECVEKLDNEVSHGI